MFTIKENSFFEKGIVKYEDQDGNTVFLKSEKDGTSFTIKVRLKDKTVTISPLTFSMPYDVNGINFHIDKSYEMENEEEYEKLKLAFEEYKQTYVQGVLMQAIELIGRWIEISILLGQFSAVNMQKIAQITSMSEDNKAASYMNILNELDNYEEMQDLSTIYHKYILEEE